MTQTDDDQEAVPAWLDNLRPHFEVGQRVRVRLNGECDYCKEAIEHGVNGALGTIWRIGIGEVDFGTRDSGTHIIWVDFDEPIPRWGPLDHFAAEELEPLTPSLVAVDRASGESYSVGGEEDE